MRETLLNEIRALCEKYMDSSDISGKRLGKAAANITGSGIAQRYIGGDEKHFIDITVSAITPMTKNNFEEMAELILGASFDNVSDIYFTEAPHMSDNTASTSKYEMTLRFIYYAPNI